MNIRMTTSLIVFGLLAITSSTWAGGGGRWTWNYARPSATWNRAQWRAFCADYAFQVTHRLCSADYDNNSQSAAGDASAQTSTNTATGTSTETNTSTNTESATWNANRPCTAIATGPCAEQAFDDACVETTFTSTYNQCLQQHRTRQSRSRR